MVRSTSTWLLLAALGAAPFGYSAATSMSPPVRDVESRSPTVARRAVVLDGAIEVPVNPQPPRAASMSPLPPARRTPARTSASANEMTPVRLLLPVVGSDEAVAEPPTPPVPPGEIPAFPQAVEFAPSRAAVLPVTGPAGVPQLAEYTSCPRQGVACGDPCQCSFPTWNDERCLPWEVFAQGEYVGPARLAHLPEYRLRVDDVVEFVFRLTGEVTGRPYRINVGDTIRVESLTAENVDRDVLIQPDGTITLRQLGQVPAAGRTVDELRADLEERYSRWIRNPAITVTPLKFNTRLEELRATVDGRFGSGGQSRQARVTPEGTVQLPAIGSVPAQGLTLDELKAEIEYRYDQLVTGIEITPVLIERAPRFAYVVGEVPSPGRYVLEGPTTVLQAVALAGSWNIGAKLDHVVVLRRDDQWRLMATRLDLHDALFGREPCPPDEIWLRDSDVIIVPKRPIQWTGDLIEMFFTRGLYGVVPMQYSVNFSKLSSI